MKAYLLLSMLFISFAPLALSKGKNTATITKFYGKVRLFKNPSKVKKGKGPFAQIDGKYYQVRKAKKGMVLKPYERIQTGKRAKAKLVYENGDQITVSADTSYEVALSGKAGVKKPVYEMIFGKFRGLIRNDGPRNDMEVRTKTMTMGVRGTDFFISARGKSGRSEVSVLRGEVAVKGRESKAKPVKVSQGFSVQVGGTGTGAKEKAKAKAKAKVEQEIKVEPTDKQVISKIFKETVITKKELAEQKEIDAKEDPSSVARDQKVEKQLAKLETAAFEAAKRDVKIHDPELYKKISKLPPEKLNSADQIQEISTKKAFDAAPKPKETKARFNDLDSSDIYDKYFNK